MNFAKKVVIAVGLDEISPESLKIIKTMDFLTSSEVHLVTVFKTIDYAYGLGEYSLVFPLPDDREKMEASILQRLNKISKEVIPAQFKGKLETHCLFDENPKEKLTEYAAQIHADTIIIAARKKRGLFESSFAQYVTKHSDANVIVLKHY